MFNNKNSANEFLQYLNSRHNNVEFTIEFEHDSEIPFFDILVKSGPNTIFMTSVYPEKVIHRFLY